MAERRYDAGAGRPVLLLAHGAGAGHDHPWMRRVAQGLCDRGVSVVTFNFPYTERGKRLPDRAPVLEASFEAAWRAVSADRPTAIFAGGKSMGGRIASQVAARGALDPAPRGLVFFGYPLHPPGKPAASRDRHLPDVGAPMLFLSGTRDPFASPEELTALVARLPGSTVELVEGGDHSLVGRGRSGGALVERAIDAAAAWIAAH